MRTCRRQALLLGLAAGTAGLLSACAPYPVAPVVPPRGGIYTHVHAPLTTRYDSTVVGGATQKHTMTRTHWFGDPVYTQWGLAWDDPELREEAYRAGITDFSYADYELLEILGIYREYTITLYGGVATGAKPAASAPVAAPAAPAVPAETPPDGPPK